MKREAFKMYLKPGCEAEYEKRHAAIWPELKALLSQNGVSDYSIYWDKETNILFAFQKTEALFFEQALYKLGESGGVGVAPLKGALFSLYGGYHGSESGQFTGIHSFAGSIPHGLSFQ